MYRTPARDRAAAIVAANWRIRRRLPLIHTYARDHGFIGFDDSRGLIPVHGFVETENGQVSAWLRFAVSEAEAIRIVTAQAVHVTRCWVDTPKAHYCESCRPEHVRPSGQSETIGKVCACCGVAFHPTPSNRPLYEIDGVVTYRKPEVS